MYSLYLSNSNASSKYTSVAAAEKIAADGVKGAIDMGPVTAANGSFFKEIKVVDGVMTTQEEAFVSDVEANSDSLVAPQTAAVKTYVDAQNELTNMSIEGSAGNGSVSVICDGKGQFKSIKLSAEAINPENPSAVSADDVEMLEDLITSAMKTALDKSKTEMEAKMKSVTGGVNIPGLTL